MSVTTAPSSPPPTKAISASSTVHRAAWKRSPMSRMLKSRISTDLRGGDADRAATRKQHSDEHAERAAERERQADIEPRRDQIDFEAPEVARLDRVGGRCQFIRTDRRYDAGTEHEQRELTGEGRIN